jgi:transcription elongation factor GreA-like protein
MNDDFTSFYKTIDSVKTPEVAREAMVNLRDLNDRYNGYAPQPEKFKEAMTYLKSVIEHKNVPKRVYVPSENSDEGSDFDF